LPIVAASKAVGEKLHMQHRARPPLDHREAAARFRLLADIEPWPPLRQHFRQLAAHYDEAARLESDPKAAG